MTTDELFAALAPLTKLKNPRDLAEHKARTQEAKIPDDLVKESLRQLLAGTYVERMAFIKRMVDVLPYDVCTAVNQQLVKLPAYGEMIRVIHAVKEAAREG